MEMFQNICVVGHRRIASSIKFSVRAFSAQPAVNYKPNNDEFEKAKPFREIPGLTKFELIKRFMPGGKFASISMADVLKSLRGEFGDFYKMPGLFGRKTMITTYNPDDVEFIHRNESTYPFRRGLESMEHFRKNIRSDIYGAGGLIVE